MPETLGGNLRRHPVREHERGARMTEPVRSEARQTERPGGAAEHPREVLGMVGTAGRLREDVVARFVVDSGKLLGRLLAPLRAKDADKTGVEVDAANGIQALACRGDDVVTDVGRELDDADDAGPRGRRLATGARRARRCEAPNP